MVETRRVGHAEFKSEIHNEDLPIDFEKLGGKVRCPGCATLFSVSRNEWTDTAVLEHTEDGEVTFEVQSVTLKCPNGHESTFSLH